MEHKMTLFHAIEPINIGYQVDSLNLSNNTLVNRSSLLTCPPHIGQEMATLNLSTTHWPTEEDS